MCDSIKKEKEKIKYSCLDEFLLIITYTFHIESNIWALLLLHINKTKQTTYTCTDCAFTEMMIWCLIRQCHKIYTHKIKFIDVDAVFWSIRYQHLWDSPNTWISSSCRCIQELHSWINNCFATANTGYKGKIMPTNYIFPQQKEEMLMKVRGKSQKLNKEHIRKILYSGSLFSCRARQNSTFFSRPFVAHVDTQVHLFLSKD